MVRGKAIILGRVSTEGQDLDQQTEKLLEAAKRDGYSERQIIQIAVKESGISLGELERKGINEMKQIIEAGENISCVYIYEVTRLARRGDENFKVKQYLVDRKIQLVCLKPEFRLLPSDGAINQMANVAFGMLAVFAEQEMYNTKDRMMRGKRYAKEQGRFIGGKVRYGYTLDKRKHIIINEREATIVREVFDMMCSGLHSYNSIANEMIERGEFIGITTARKKVQNILKGIAYCGIGGGGAKYNYNYPPIIDTETYKKAQEQLSKNQIKPKRVYKHIFLGRGIIKDCNGYIMIGKKRATEGSNYYAHSTHSNSGLSIASNPLDASLWFIAKSQYENVQELNKMVGVDRTKKAIEELIQKIEQAEKNVEAIQESIDRVEDRYIRGRISEAKADKMEEEFRRKQELERKNIVKFNDQLRQLEAPVEESEGFGDIEAIEDAELKHRIVKLVIEYVQIVRTTRNIYNMEVHYTPLFSGTKGTVQTFVLNTTLKHQELSLEDGSWTIQL